MRITGLCLVTDDVPRLRAFYERVLLVETEGDDTFVFVRAEGAALSLFSRQGMERMAPGSTAEAGTGGYTIEVQVDDVDAEAGRLEELGVTFVKPPTTQAWGRRSVWFRDPDGNVVNFYAPTVADA
jgi:catechol 2,3-dioxygenase-like lactoylglutathione lyase family enzyme